MLEEYSPILSEFLTNGINEKVQQGTQLFSDALNWAIANQAYILCVVVGFIIGMIVHKMRKKQ
jgi:hypothetical protein